MEREHPGFSGGPKSMSSVLRGDAQEQTDPGEDGGDGSHAAPAAERRPEAGRRSRRDRRPLAGSLQMSRLCHSWGLDWPPGWGDWILALEVTHCYVAPRKHSCHLLCWFQNTEGETGQEPLPGTSQPRA